MVDPIAKTLNEHGAHPGDAEPGATVPTINMACHVVGAGADFISRNGHLYAAAISAQSVGAQKIHMQIVRMPPGARAKARKHEGHETAVYVLSGEAGIWYGERLEQHLLAPAGDFFYIPADVPHLPYNTRNAESYVAVVARTDPNEQESIMLLPELDEAHDS